MMRKNSLIAAALSAALLMGCAQTAEPVAESLPAQPVVDIELDIEDARVSFLGPEGTYTQEACEVFFGGEGEYVPYETVPAAVEALVNGESEFAVIPQENTIGGAVIDYIDVLIANPDVSVAGEVELTINQNLLVLPGTNLDEITTVYSHRQGIAQGSEWLAANLPDAEVIEVSSTAEGARMVSEGGDSSCAAIASAGCADVYDLEVLASAIQNNDNNRTRFYVLTCAEPSTVTAGRLAFTASGSAFGLPSVMAALDEAGAVLVTIHDRPLKTVLGEYTYVIECEGLTYEEYCQIVSGSALEFRFLGSFNSISN